MALKPLNWAVFISGRGSNLGAILECQRFLNVRLVVSSRGSAFGLVRARRSGVPSVVLSRTVDWTHLNQILRKHHIDCVFLAGFMKILPAAFVQEWPCLNVHPSLLPFYPGLQSIERAAKDQADIGVTVHQATAEMDAGPHAKSRKVVSKERVVEYSLEEITRLVHVTEHRLVREVLLKWKPPQQP